ncbi:SHOCT domain-containing protein [Kitasatospora sp. NPDC101157]|uniref:SHOCT domain-containing protein n=1 Tax=Kitasatospora sp. NPDC101157 TaxID=3364098 RepID=UPI0037FB5A5A
MPGLIRGVARTAAVAGTATAVSNHVSRRQAGRWAQQDAQAAASQKPPPAAAPSGNDDTIAQLQKLGALKEQGVLTEAEFAAQKAKLLGT